MNNLYTICGGLLFHHYFQVICTEKNMAVVLMLAQSFECAMLLPELMNTCTNVDEYENN